MRKIINASKLKIVKSRQNLTKLEMKKIILLGIVLSLSLSSFSQTRFGIKGGLSLADVSIKSEGIGIDITDVKPGFHIGAVVDYSLTEIIDLETGLMFETKGLKSKASILGGASGKAVTTTSYLSIPINLKASYDFRDFGVYGLFGPYVGVALSSKDKYTGDYKDLMGMSEYDNKIGNSDTDDIKTMDFGLSLGAGVEVNEFLFGVEYDLGLANIIPGGDSDNFMKNRVFKISVGIMLE